MNAPQTLEDHNRQIADAYDEVVYVSNAFPYTAPGHLRAAAHLYGVETVPLERARVLELGCAAGGNLIPFALAYPHAQVVGVDLSPVQIAHGLKVIEDLALQNMHLHALDLTTINADLGQFDYIIVHGVFSWVPPEVKREILRVCRENLSPKGIAYISYNTYPGWKAGDIVRDAMMLHCHGAADAEERLGRAKAMLHMLAEGLAESHGMGTSIRRMAKTLAQQSDYYISHEYLEQFNTPCYLVEFADLAAQMGLAYVGDAESFCELPASYGANVQLQLSLMAIGQPKVMRQQYLDFAMGRNFRKSLLVHQERISEVAVVPSRDAMRHLRWAGRFVRVDDPTIPVGSRAFKCLLNRSIQVQDRAIFALVETIGGAWPKSVTYSELCAALQRERSDLDGDDLRRATDMALEKLFSLGTLRHALEPTPYDLEVENGPVKLIPAFVYLYRRMAEPDCAVGAVNFWHDAVVLEMTGPFDWVVRQMDGDVDRSLLTSNLLKALQQGVIPGPDGESMRGQRNLEPVAQRIVNKVWASMRDCGLFVR